MEGCPGVSATRAAMRVHFVHRHVNDTVFILDEGNLPLTRCPRCDPSCDSTWKGRNTAAPLGPLDDWGAQVVKK